MNGNTDVQVLFSLPPLRRALQSPQIRETWGMMALGLLDGRLALLRVCPRGVSN
jgi:hypothetical protein